jgi:hypothetical protein
MNLYFTRLNTVKCSSYEYTISDFFDILTKNIKSDPSDSYVKYNEEEGTYQIKLDDSTEEYTVYYNNEPLRKDSNNELVSTLEKFINFTDKSISQKNDQENYDDLKKKAVNDGNKGIFKSDDAKHLYIDYLNEEIGELNKELKAPMFDKSEDIEDRIYNIINTLRHERIPNIISKTFDMLLAFALNIGIIVLVCSTEILWFLLLLIPGLFVAFAYMYNIGEDEHVLSLDFFIASLIKFLFERKKDKKHTKEKINGINKKIAALYKSINHSKISLKGKSLADDVLKHNMVTEEEYQQIKTLVYELRDKVLKMENKQKKAELGTELSDILNFVLNNKDSIRVQDITDRLKRLSYQLDKEIEIERRINERNNSIDALVDDCNKIISKSL